jgi:hypothetical protein
LQLSGVTYRGDPAPADQLERLPPDLRKLLSQQNGFIAFFGGLHVRGVGGPEWHALATVWEGPLSLQSLYPEVIKPGDIPFAEDALGDQYLLRDDKVYRLRAESGVLEALDLGLFPFLAAAEKDPVNLLEMEPLIHYQHQQGGTLDPGQLLLAYPPFCTAEAKQGVSLRPVAAREAIAVHAEFARAIAAAP